MRRGALRQAVLFLAALELLSASQPSSARGDPLEGLTVEQREFCESPARRKVVTGGRRSGKTHALVAKLCSAAMAGGACAYISLTRGLAKKTVWKRLKTQLGRLCPQLRVNETELTIELPNGGSVMLGGADDREAVERYRGLAYALVVIDECGSQPRALLEYLVTDVLRPALMDHAGELVLAGTPSPVLGGYWFDQAAPDGMRRAAHPRWEWTIHHNPLFAGRVESELAAVREENDWSEESITYRREYLGEWVRDESLLVYPFDPERNAVDQLPQRSPRGNTLPGRQWRHVIAVDCGTTEDSMAIVVLAMHPLLPDDYVVHAEAHTGMLIDHLLARLRALRMRYPKAQIVVDSGGLGAVHALELSHSGLPIVAAKKTDKASAIRVLHDRVVAGRIKLLSIAALDGLRKEWRSLGWDDDHLQHHPDQADHYSDATLYALRELRHWHTRVERERRDLDPLDEVAEAAEAAEHTW